MTKSLLLSIALISFSLFSKAQTSHTIVASNFMFTPSALTVNVGDTVFVDIQGNHTCTEISEANWMINNPVSNGGFWVGQGSSTGTNWFVLTAPGMHYYICIPHASGGMKGTINVEDTSVGFDEVTNNNTFKINNLGSGEFSFNYRNCNELSIYNISGKLISTINLQNSEEFGYLNLGEFPEGIYFGAFKNNGTVVTSVKFFR